MNCNCLNKKTAACNCCKSAVGDTTTGCGTKTAGLNMLKADFGKTTVEPDKRSAEE